MATGRYKLVRRKRPSNKPLEREPVELEEWQEPRPVRGRGRGAGIGAGAGAGASEAGQEAPEQAVF
jgi:hypothetical protein